MEGLTICFSSVAVISREESRVRSSVCFGSPLWPHAHHGATPVEELVKFALLSSVPGGQCLGWGDADTCIRDALLHAQPLTREEKMCFGRPLGKALDTRFSNRALHKHVPCVSGGKLHAPVCAAVVGAEQYTGFPHED